MKITTEKLTIWAKRAVLTLALAATAGVMLPSCEKDKIQQHDEVIWFYSNNLDNLRFGPDTIQKYAADKHVRYIYITVAPGEKFTSFSSSNISACRRELQMAMSESPKCHGRGNFEFEPGFCNRGDSLDFVAMGFTVNQQNR